ncbi:hypothetical protein D9M70_622020 [compost metagenome]
MNAQALALQNPKLAGHVLEGEIVPLEAVIPGWEMAYMNFAREEFQRLEELLRCVVMPGLGGYQNPVCKDLDQYIENVRMCSRNFCWKHRAVGAGHVMGERP